MTPLQKMPRVNILGVGISAVDIPSAVGAADRHMQNGGSGYICVTGVHGIMECQRDAELRRIHNRSFLTVPDGMPTVWIGKAQRFKMERVYGPDFMLEFCRSTLHRQYRHFLYGGKAGVAAELKSSLERLVPGIQIVGVRTPPFRSLDSAETTDLLQAIEDCKPDVMWIGLSTPKQERFMSEFLPQMQVRMMVGVGAAFDIHTGRLKDAPAWIKKLGLQWAHRLAQDYQRLWRRYLVNNPMFILMWSMQVLRIKSYDQAITEQMPFTEASVTLGSKKASIL